MAPTFARRVVPPFVAGNNNKAGTHGAGKVAFGP